MRQVIGETWLDREELAYNTYSGTQWGSNRKAKVRFPDGKLRTVTAGIADTYFSIPAHGKVGGKTVVGWIGVKTEGNLDSGEPIEFVFHPSAPKEAE